MKLLKFVTAVTAMTVLFLVCVIAGALLFAGLLAVYAFGLPIDSYGELAAVVAFALVGGFCGYLLYAEVISERVIAFFGRGEES